MNKVEKGQCENSRNTQEIILWILESNTKYIVFVFKNNYWKKSIVEHFIPLEIIKEFRKKSNRQNEYLYILIMIGSTIYTRTLESKYHYAIFIDYKDKYQSIETKTQFKIN
jgi:hypothetical protein